MALTDYIPKDDQELSDWLENFRTKLNAHATELGMSQGITGTVAADSTSDIAQGPFTNDMVVKLENTGNSLLRFCIGITPSTACTAPGGVLVNPSEIITTTIEELGGEQGNYLNVTASSPGASIPGDYRVTLPNAEVMNISVKITSLQNDIADVKQARNAWKQSAEKKDNNKQATISELLRPFIKIKVKGNALYTTDIGKDMDILGEAPVVDPNTMKPVLKGEVTAQGVLLRWKKGAADALNIYADRKDGKGFLFLTTDIQPDYVDTTPLPAGVNSAVWNYKAIYVINDEEVGQFSENITITVSRNTGV